MGGILSLVNGVNGTIWGLFSQLGYWTESRLLGQRKASPLERRIEEKLKARAKQVPSRVKTFNSVLMKLGQLQRGFEMCRVIFEKVDVSGDNSISFDELRGATKTLGYVGSEEDLQAIFTHSDIDGLHSLSFREFLVALVFLNILEETPETEVPKEVLAACDIATDAFFFFDKDGSGLLNKREVLEASYEKKEGLPESMVRRFEEMDVDRSGRINLAEFVYTLEAWAGIEQDEE